jgi:hypothetical protein
MLRSIAVERNHDPASTLRVNPVTALRPQPKEPDFNSRAPASAAVKRGSLGMNFDSSG